MISFVVEKLAGKKIELLLDERRKAARQFLRLYHALADLEVLTKELIVELHAMIKEDNPEVSREWLSNVTIAVDETSQRFLEASLGLRDVLEVFDPILAATVSELEAHKFSFLIIASHGFEPLHPENDNHGVKYTYGGARLQEIDLNEQYRWYEANYPMASTKSLEWPGWVIHGFVEEGDIKEDRLVLREPESMQRLAALLEQHVTVLSDARAGLANLLRDRFNLEDLLAICEPVTQFDRIHAMHRMSSAVAIPYTRFFAGKPTRRIRETNADRDGNNTGQNEKSP